MKTIKKSYKWRSSLCPLPSALFTLLLGCILCMSAKVKAQTNFNEGKTFKEILQMATEQGKPVFIDCFTDWCGPCKQMARDVFPQKAAGDYFNTKFVCWKVDMEKGEGPELAKKYDVAAYPTFLILNADGTLRATQVGSAPLDRFIATIDGLMNQEKGLPWYQEQFRSGNRDEAFLRDYMEVLDRSYLRTEKKQVVEALLSSKTPEQIVADSVTLRTFLGANFTPDDKLFLDVYRLRSTILSNFGKQPVGILDKAWKQGARMFMDFDGREFKSFDMDQFQAYKQKMAANNVPDIEQIEDATLVAVANYQKDYQTLAKYLEKDIKTGGAVWPDSRDLVPLLQGMAEKFAQDKKMKKLLVRALESRIALLEKQNAENPDARQVTVSGVKMTAAQFFMQNFQTSLESLKK